MKPHSSNHTDTVQTNGTLKTLGGLAAALVATAVSGCTDHAAAPTARAAFVRTEIVQPRDRQASVTLTGEIQARFRADLSFRVSGRVLARYVDVGAHVKAGEVLALLDPAEQQADVDAATAAVLAAESQLRVAKATFERQKALIASGFTTRTVYDQAQEGLRTTEGVLEAAKAELGTSKGRPWLYCAARRSGRRGHRAQSGSRPGRAGRATRFLAGAGRGTGRRL